MSTILIKDSLRQAVEAASGGAQTVLYTTKGQPTFMNIIEKFNLSDLDASLSGTHPAFIVNGVEKDAIYIGTYEGVVKNGELLSLPNQSPTLGISFDSYVAAARANGAGHHIITSAEWAAVSTKCAKSSVSPLGNSYYGRSSEDATQYGRRIDGAKATAGITTGSPGTLTGSGPVSWRHNRKYNGISDMSGNFIEHTAGCRLFNGEIQVIPNNDAAMANIDLTSSSAAWKAIDARTGELIAPNGSGTTPYAVKLIALGVADYSLTIPHWSPFAGMTNPSITAPVQAAALAKLKALALFPLVNDSSVYGGDVVGLVLPGERLLHRSGLHRDGATTGIHAAYFNLGSGVASDRACRPAYYVV